ncbi:MAG TPA: hypothetical protein VH478_19185 [Trebonia sp.]|nr:hypothetical protein [Trebonia sp.]
MAGSGAPGRAGPGGQRVALSAVAATLAGVMVLGSATGAGHWMAAGDAGDSTAAAGTTQTLASTQSTFGSSWPQEDPRREWFSAILGGILSGAIRVY